MGLHIGLFNLIWRRNEPGDLSFLLHISMYSTPVQNLNKFYVIVIYVFLTLIRLLIIAFSSNLRMRVVFKLCDKIALVNKGSSATN